jgi:hypothetical protein
MMMMMMMMMMIGVWSSRWNEKWQEKPMSPENDLTLLARSPTWSGRGSNRGCRGVKPATNRLSYGMA